MPTAVLNLDALTYQQLAEAVDLLTVDFDKALRRLRPVIVSWDYSADLHADDPFDKLGFDEPFEIASSIVKAYNAAAEALAATLKVDFKRSNWTYRDNLDFNHARAEGKFGTVQAMLRRLVSIPGDDPEKPLGAVHGAAALNAYQEAYKRVLTAKN